MAGRSPPSPRNGRALARAARRSISFSGPTDLDIAERLGNHPDVTSITDFPTGSIEGISPVRIAYHVGRSVRLPSPSSQQIQFETPSQNLGVGAILVTAVMIKLYMRRISHSATPCPNHFEPGRFRDCDTTDILQIAALPRRLIAGRIDGRTLSGANFVYRSGLTFGARIDNAAEFPNEEIIFRLGGRTHLSAAQLITDIRRFFSPLDSLANYLPRTIVAFRGLGFHMLMQYNEAILIISDVFLLSSGPGRPISGLTDAIRPGSRFDIESTARSVPSWIEGGQDAEEELWRKLLLLDEPISVSSRKLTVSTSAAKVLHFPTRPCMDARLRL